MFFNNNFGFEYIILYPLYAFNISKSLISFPMVYISFGFIFSFLAIISIPSFLFVGVFNKNVLRNDVHSKQFNIFFFFFFFFVFLLLLLLLFLGPLPRHVEVPRLRVQSEL